ncbi:MAG: TonB-dependent receptor [Pseudomonadota bacterium]
MATWRSRISLISSVSLATLMVSAGGASAQNGAQTGGFTSLGLIVFGAGIERVAVDTPQAVTVITQEEIDQEIPETVASLLERIPGVNVTGAGDNLFGQNFNIRGFGPQTVGSNQEGRVQVNVDGATKYYESYRMGGFFSDVSLYKSVEVLRGPASGTLYSTSVLGGVINFVTKDASDFLDPGETAAFRSSVLYDSNQEGYRLSKTFAYRFNEHLEFLGNFNYTDFDDIIDGNGNARPNTAQDYPSGLLKWTINFGEDNEQTARFKYETTRTSGVTSLTPGGEPTNNLEAQVYRKTQDTSFLFSYENPDFDNPWFDFNFSATYSKLRNEQFGLNDIIRADLSYTYYEVKADNTFEWITDDYENYLTFGIAGKYHERRREDLDGRSVSSHPEGNETYFGAFVQNEFIWQDTFTLITGFRADWRELEPSGSTLLVPDFSAPRIPGPESVSDIGIAPKIAAIYEVFDDFNIFASAAYTQRLPGIDEEFDWNANFVQNDLDTENAYSVEGGISQTIDELFLEADQLQYKITGFYNHIEDRIIRAGGAEPDWINSGEADIYGVEVEAAYDSEYFFASAYASLLRGEDTTRDEPLPSIAPDEFGFTVGGKIPQYDIRFGWDARFVADEKEITPVLGMPNPRFGITQADVERAFAADLLREEGFNTHDLWATWRPQTGKFEGLEVSARVDNIADEFYQEFLGTAGPSKGRTFRASLAYTVSF